MSGTHSGTDPDHSTSRSGTAVTIGPLSVAEAAALLGVGQRTVIKYRQQGKVRGEKHGKAWRLWLAQDFIDATRGERSGTHSGMDPERPSARSGTHSEPVEAAFTTTTPAEVERAIEATGARYVADFAALYDRISAEVGRVYEGQLAAKDEALAAKDETIMAVRAERDAVVDELRRRAEAAEDEIDALRARYELARRGEKESDHRLSDALALQLHPPAGESSPRHEGLRARLGRWWRGEP